MAQNQVLKSTETTSEPFRFFTSRTGEKVTPQIITFPDDGDAWPGETWELELLTPDGSWTEQGQSWDDFGSMVFYAVAGESYRLTGGTVGAEAYASDVG